MNMLIKFQSVDPDAYLRKNPSDILALLLNESDLSNLDINLFLEESYVQDDKPNKQDFLNEIDVTPDAIILQSSLNIKACADIPALRRIIEKEKLVGEPYNSLYSPKIINLLYRWFAYIPFWSCIMTNFFERYAKDGKNVSTSDWEFGHGRVSNATVEKCFRTVKSSVLEYKINLRPADFLMRTYSHTLSRMKGDKFGVAQSSRGRKKALSKADDLNAKETWWRRVQSKTKNGRRAYYFSNKVSQTNACKLS
ncbi:unnamed protein product [Didymodactylos carnosus]|uniref:Uncharacterized protein n=1 Tax=Didymodactylos carnosus TaxID=1234261 RepID=A0A815R9D5_9BILA|nr:unnamed protein product [Didymodactylos carnosus]CAF1473806.1 unnamed protein product [Didymodactylos carnosus]CAF4004265.1 unnamed protein product [Didymodactylos carnosus]CAF4340637.1 unnamed protein product [Didymodactylos carnosus]